MELVYFKVLVKHFDQKNDETGETIMEGQEEYYTIPIHEIATWLQQNVEFFKSVQVVSKELQVVVDKCEYDDLENKNQELKDKLDNAYDFFDNILSKIDDLKSSIGDIEYYADEVVDEATYGQNECLND